MKTAATDFAGALVVTGASTAVLLAAVPAFGAQSLNANIDEICQGFAVLNRDLGAPVAPGAPASSLMQQQLKITSAQYDALWSLMKLTPTPACTALY